MKETGANLNHYFGESLVGHDKSAFSLRLCVFALIDHGLLMNFGEPKFEIRKYALSQADTNPRSGSVFGVLLSVLASFAFFRG